MASRAVGEPISIDTARRITLQAQGFGAARPSGSVDRRQIRKVIERVGVLQLDSVNVLCRSHYLPVYSRLGLYPRGTLDRIAWGSGPRQAFEYFWGGKASLLPIELYPLLRWRMSIAARQDWSAPLEPDLAVPWSVVEGMRRLSVERPGFVDDVLAIVTERGPISAGDANPDGERRQKGDPDPDPSTGTMWNWQDAKIAVEYLFATGRVAIAGRRNFERLYDLTERVMPESVLALPAPEASVAKRELGRLTARSLGVATAGDLFGATRGHFRLSRQDAAQVLSDLLDEGSIAPVRVEGVSQQSYLWADASDRPVIARALLSPFDTLLWNRDRTEQLFDFFYRIGIYTPAAQRTDGYYVLPFLLGDRLVARVDLKADRRNSALLVPHANAQPGIAIEEVVGPLAAEVALMAQWLGLDRVDVQAVEPLGRALRSAVR